MGVLASVLCVRREVTRGYLNVLFSQTTNDLKEWLNRDVFGASLAVYLEGDLNLLFPPLHLHLTSLHHLNHLRQHLPLGIHQKTQNLVLGMIDGQLVVNHPGTRMM
jgi:hypothetical protein